MSLAWFHLDPLPTSDVVVLDGPEGRHAATVRRIRVGEQIVLGDGHGRHRRATVTAVGRDQLRLRAEPVEDTPALAPRLVVVQALPKGERAELAVALLTELGVDEIVPWSAARSIVEWRAERGTKSRDRWRASAREAGKQSRRAWFPVVGDLADTAGVVERIGRSAGALVHRMGTAEVESALVLHDEATAPLVGVARPEHGEILVVVGPEGGISPAEAETFAAAGARPVRLGAPVLRTSTAGAAALAVLSARLGRWD